MKLIVKILVITSFCFSLSGCGMLAYTAVMEGIQQSDVEWQLEAEQFTCTELQHEYIKHRDQATNITNLTSKRRRGMTLGLLRQKGCAVPRKTAAQ